MANLSIMIVYFVVYTSWTAVQMCQKWNSKLEIENCLEDQMEICACMYLYENLVDVDFQMKQERDSYVVLLSYTQWKIVQNSES